MALYLVSSLLICLGGVLVLVLSPPSGVGYAIGVSLIAGGFASIAFAVIRYVDDLASETNSRTLTTSVGQLQDAVRLQHVALDSLRRITASMGGTSLRVYDRHPQDEVREELAAATGSVVMDVYGFTLRPFCQDWLNHLTTLDNVVLRMIVQDPRSAAFDEVCLQESRNPTLMREDVIWVTEKALGIAAKCAHISVELRWSSSYPTITMTHLNDVLFARPRFLREATQPRLFHERYAREDGIPFNAYLEQFEMAWEVAVPPGLVDVEGIQNAIRR